MRLVRNSGTNRVVDVLRASLPADFSLGITWAGSCRRVLAAVEQDGVDLLGADRIVAWHPGAAPAATAAKSNFAVIPDQQGPQNGRSS